VSIGLEAERQAVLDETESRDIVIRDLIIRSLSNRTAAELSDIKRREEIKEALVEEINTVLRQGKITRLYFTEYVLQ
jgi:flagellar FliL protein